jgi:hypothetical protein
VAAWQLFTIGLVLWTATAASQTSVPATLSAELRTHLRDGRFGLVTSVRGLPLGVRDAMQTLFRSPTLDIAEPGAEFQQPDTTINPNAPLRRMVAAGCSREYCLIYYERGGTALTWHVVLFHWTPAATRAEWGGTAPGGLATIDAVRKAVVSGAVKDQSAGW